jgi:hypothetical protein
VANTIGLGHQMPDGEIEGCSPTQLKIAMVTLTAEQYTALVMLVDAAEAAKLGGELPSELSLALRRVESEFGA